MAPNMHKLRLTPCVKALFYQGNDSTQGKMNMGAEEILHTKAKQETIICKTQLWNAKPKYKIRQGVSEAKDIHDKK